MDCCEHPMCRVVCPKPRRVAPPKLTLAPSRFHIRFDAESNNGAELLGVFFRQDSPSSPDSSYSLGSPPCRTQNPVVQDADFGVLPEKPQITNSNSNSNSFINLGKKLQAPPHPMLSPLHTIY